MEAALEAVVEVVVVAVTVVVIESLNIVAIMHTIHTCDRDCENRVCGHKLHPVSLKVIFQYWNRAFSFCSLYHNVK